MFERELKTSLSDGILRPLSEVANYTTLIDGLFLNRARTHPEKTISGMVGGNCARVFQKQQHPLRER
jgi:beta-carotene ketolase (CrtO type)